MQVVPAILEKTTDDFSHQLDKLLPYFSYFQIDIADGKFVPNKTVALEEILPVIKQLAKKITKPLIFDLHLMIKDWKKEIEKLKNLKIGKKIKIKNILIHAQTIPKKFSFKKLNNKKPHKFSLGVVLDPSDSVNIIRKKYGSKNLPVIQIMSVNPGLQGSPFIQKTLKKIEQLRRLSYRSKIFLDGGINDKTIPQILSQKYQPDILAIGSFLTKAKNIEEKVSYLKKTIG